MTAFTSIAVALFAVLPHASGLQIVDSNGEPVAGATVRIWMPPRAEHDPTCRVRLCEGVTSKDGWTSCSVPTLTGALFVVEAPRFGPPVEKLDRNRLRVEALRSGSWGKAPRVTGPNLADTLELRALVLLLAILGFLHSLKIFGLILNVVLEEVREELIGYAYVGRKIFQTFTSWRDSIKQFRAARPARKELEDPSRSPSDVDELAPVVSLSADVVAPVGRVVTH